LKEKQAPDGVVVRLEFPVAVVHEDAYLVVVLSFLAPQVGVDAVARGHDVGLSVAVDVHGHDRLGRIGGRQTLHDLELPAAEIEEDGDRIAVGRESHVVPAISVEVGHRDAAVRDPKIGNGLSLGVDVRHRLVPELAVAVSEEHVNGRLPQAGGTGDDVERAVPVDVGHCDVLAPLPFAGSPLAALTKVTAVVPRTVGSVSGCPGLTISGFVFAAAFDLGAGLRHLFVGGSLAFFLGRPTSSGVIFSVRRRSRASSR
jgi:hypothetical protein